MKKISTILSLLLSFVVAFGQSSFPVEVTNQFDPIPSWAYNTGQKNNAYTIQYVTRTQVEAAVNTSIGHLYALNGSFAPQPGKATIVRGYTIASTKPVTMQIRVGTPTGVVASANIPEMDLAILADSTPQYIPVNWIIRNIKSTFIYCLNFMRAEDTAAWITVTPDCYNIPDDFNWTAKKRMLWIGTSITNGTGPTSTGTMYHTLFKDTLRKLGVSLRHELCGISGSTSATHVPFFTQGAYDNLSDGRPPDIVVIELAVNDASAGTATATYVARLRYDAERFLSNPENKKIMVLILGATPLQNNTAYNNSVTLDAAASVMVTQLQAIYPNRIWFVPLSASFDRTNFAFYAQTDTPGFGIHIGDAGNQLVNTVGFGGFLSTSGGVTFLTNAKK